MKQIGVVKICRVFYESYKFSTHAEKDAIKKVKDKNILKKCKIYIIKIKNDNVEQAIPCEMCNKLLKKYGINKIYRW
jgi:cytidine deaminase